jgi:hypothetical protein
MNKGTNFGANVQGVTIDRGAPNHRHTPHYERWELEAALKHRNLTRRERRALDVLTKPRRGKP